MEKGFTFVEFLIVVAILGIIVGTIGAVVFGLGFPFTGEQTGYITAVERGGLFNIPNVYIKTDVSSSQEDRYCLSGELYSQAQTVSKDKKLVTVSFQRGWFMPFWSCNSENYKVVGIK